MPDYLPAPDAQFTTWQANFVTYANAILVALGLVAGDMTPITTAQTAWGTAYTDNVAKQNAAQAARALKDMKRAAYEGAIRPLVKRLQASASVDDSEKAALGITVPDTIPTPTAVPTSKPVIQVECASRLEQSVGFADEGTPTKKAKPAGVRARPRTTCSAG